MNEKRDKRQTVFISVIGIATLLFAIIGATFAYFSIEVIGNEEASSVRVKTDKLGVIVFRNGSEVSIENAYPGAYITKEFTVSLTDSDDNSVVSYYVYLDEHKNEFAENNVSAFEHHLLSAEALLNEEGTVLGELDWETVPNMTYASPIFSGTFVGNDTHTYVYEIGLKEMDVEQNEAQDLEFAGKLRVESADGGKYTAYGSAWSGSSSSAGE